MTYDTDLHRTPPDAAGTGGGTGTVREAVGVFDSQEALQQAVDALSLAGFERHELSLMADDATLRDRLGLVPARVEDVKHDPDVPRESFVAPEEVGNAKGVAIAVPAYVGAVLATGAVLASGGTALAAALFAAAAGAGGGALGGALSGWLGEERETRVRDQLAKGGLLLWVNLRNAERERVAHEILARHSIHPVEVHDVLQAGSR